MFWTVRSGSLCGGSRRWLKSQNWEYAVPITKRRAIWGLISQFEPKSDAVCPLTQFRSLESPKPNDARFGAQFRNLNRNRTPFAPLHNFGPWSLQNQTTQTPFAPLKQFRSLGSRKPNDARFEAQFRHLDRNRTSFAPFGAWSLQNQTTHDSVPGVSKTKRRMIWGSISQFEPKSDAVCPP